MTRSPALHILLLSESEALAALDRRTLRDAGVARVDSMVSGVEAARMLAGLDGGPEAAQPDMVVCSQRLGDMDGEQFCAIVRLHPLLLDLPILLILPNDSEVEQLRTLGCGASALLARPYSVSALQGCLESLAASRQSLAQLHKAEHLADTRAFDAALETYGLLLKPVRLPEDYFRVGMQCLERKQWNNAINAFQRALRGALIQGKAELGMAVAWKGKGDAVRYRQYLARASATFVRARQWHRARAVYVRLLREDPAAKSPFLAEAFQLMKQNRHDEAAEILAQGFDVTPRRQLSEKIAETCLTAQEPEVMLRGLEESLGRTLGKAAGPLSNDIRDRLESLSRQLETRRREEAAERQWRAARQAERQKEAATQGENPDQAGQPETRAAEAASSGMAAGGAQTAVPAQGARAGEGMSAPPRAGQAHAAPVAALWGEPAEPVPAGRGEPGPAASGAPVPGSGAAHGPGTAVGGEAPILAPLTEAEATSGFFNGKPGINELLSVMKYTWKLARRHK